VTGPILALRGAILDLALADADLAMIMGGQVRLHDEPPRASEPVYVVFGAVSADDWSTDTDRGHEQRLSLVVWAKAGSARSALLAAERLAALLDGAALTLDGHRLINLRLTATNPDRDAQTNLARVTLILRAVTEVA
jgi:Protein of unknown function (DUF3168)